MSKTSSKPQKIRFPTLLHVLISLSLFRICRSTVFIPNSDLSSTPLDPTQTGFMMAGTVNNDYLGYAISTAGDINGDGFSDVLVGAFGKESSKGYVYVIYGGADFSSSYANLDLTTLNPATTGFLIKGNAAGDKFGYSVSFAGKVNDDDYDDIIIGATGKSSSKGIVYVIYGRPTSDMENIDLAVVTLDPLTNGFSIVGEANNDNFGWAVNTAGDVDNDGYDDMVIGAAKEASSQGAVYVIYGKPNSQRSASLYLAITSLGSGSSLGFKITGTAGGDYLGISVSTGGKVNNDEYDDVIIAAYGWNGNQGQVYVVYGGPKSSCQNINLATTPLVPTATGFTMTGTASSNFGKSIDTPGDLNQDGYDDIVIGAYTGNGLIYVIYGREASLLADIDFTMTTLDPQTTGFTITDSSTLYHLGYSTRAAGDVNGDGYPDIIAGQDLYQSSQGAVYVIYGGKSSDMANIDVGVTPLDPATTGFKLVGTAGGDNFGYTVSPAGDINGDGYDDILVGAYPENNMQGAAYVVYSSCVSSSGTCKERVFCESCDEGFSVTNSKCQSCPTNCQEYSGPTTCQACDSKYYLESSKLCGSCPSHCLQCENSGSCEVCEEGYFLSNSLCAKHSETLKTLSTTLQALSDTINVAGAVLSIGSSLFPVTKLVSKIVQNTRYLGLIVTDELNQVYQDWNTNLINVDIPDAFSSLGDFKSLNSEFSRYDIESAFLVNFWSDLVILGAIVGAYLLSYILKMFMNGGWGYPLVSRIAAGLFNLMLVQAYGCLDDVIFYFVLDCETNPFDKVFSWASFFSGLAFIGLVSLLILFNVVIVIRYQQAKSKNLEEFNENNKRWELFYGDFNDADFWSHSFLAILAVRNCLSSVIISGFYNYPLLQTSLLIILDGAIIIILMTLKPLGELSAKLAQYFYELVALIVHICTFILAMESDQVSTSSIGKIAFCKAIIFLNYALIVGGVCLMLAEIYKTIRVKIKTWKRKSQTNKIALEEDSVNQSVLSTVKPLDLSMQTSYGQNEANIRRTRVHRQQIESNLHFERPFEEKRREESPSNNLKRGQRGHLDKNSNSLIVLKEKKKRKEALVIAKAKENFNFQY